MHQGKDTPFFSLSSVTRCEPYIIISHAYLTRDGQPKEANYLVLDQEPFKPPKKMVYKGFREF